MGPGVLLPTKLCCCSGNVMSGACRNHARCVLTKGGRSRPLVRHQAKRNASLQPRRRRGGDVMGTEWAWPPGPAPFVASGSPHFSFMLLHCLLRVTTVALQAQPVCFYKPQHAHLSRSSVTSTTQVIQKCTWCARESSNASRPGLPCRQPKQQQDLVFGDAR